MKGMEKMSNEQKPQLGQPQDIALPPEMAKQIKAQLEAQAVQEKVRQEILAILEANKCTIQVSVSLHSDMPFQAGWRVVATGGQG